MSKYLDAVMVAVDDTLNVVFGGKVGETVSAHAATARRDGRLWGCWLCSALEVLWPGHCDRALKNDELRAESVERDLGAQ